MSSDSISKLIGLFGWQLEKEESEWPPSELPDPKGLYTDFYEDIHKLATNNVCGSCGCIGHDEKQYHHEPIASDILVPLKVDPALVPFDIGSRCDVLTSQTNSNATPAHRRS